MKNFSFRGRLPGSKSILNRLYLIESFTPYMGVLGTAGCLDVETMRAGLQALEQGRLVDCRDSGTVLRFLTVRASRRPGTHLFTGKARLLSRPHEGLWESLRKFGVEVDRRGASLRVSGSGWQDPRGPVEVERSYSSQFASALLLNAWNLDIPLRLAWRGDPVSSGYWTLSVRLAEAAGMEVERTDEGIRIAPRQTVKRMVLEVEPDMGAAFAICAVALVSGDAEILGFPAESLQPDRVFVDILRAMGADLKLGSSRLCATKTATLNAVERDLRDTPDLFPVLAVLCAVANGISRLTGAPHLRFKEADRIEKTAELLRRLGRVVRIRPDGLEIHGTGLGFKAGGFDFDPAEDHRLAMAAGVARSAGAPIRILFPEVVDKSFPGFWDIIGRKE